MSDMHRNNVCHRDVRPHNIYYSPTKKGFVLGGLGNGLNTLRMGQHVGINLAGVPYYMPAYLQEVGKREDYSEYYNYDP